MSEALFDPRLEKVARARRTVDEMEHTLAQAKTLLHEEIVAAHEEGFSPRQIATVAGYSHQTIRTIILASKVTG